MWTHERQAKIFERLSQASKVATAQLATEFEVSRETIRRDLLDLEERGQAIRVHGGAVLRSVEPEPSFAQRLEHFSEQKHAIGQKALEIIPQGATCFIDAGTTTRAFARILAARGDIRVITNSLEIAQIMAAGQDCETLLLGGKPHRDVPATFGEITLSQIDRFLSDFAVISPVAVHAEHGLTDYELHEAEVARAMLRRAKTSVALCHSAKIGAQSRVSICRLEEIDHLVTDQSPQGAALSLGRGQLHLAEIPPIRPNRV